MVGRLVKGRFLVFNEITDLKKMKPADVVLGIDLGGTEIKFSLFSLPSMELLKSWKKLTMDCGDAEAEPEFARTIRDEVYGIKKHQNYCLQKIGLAAPGLPDKNNQFIEFMPGRLHGIEKLQWSGFFDLGIDVKVVNDGQAALLAEIWKGAAVGSKNAVMMSIGTGVGGAIFSDGRLLKGQIGRAGHLGHVSIDYRGKQDICNTPGSIEDAVGQATLYERSYNRFSDFHSLSVGLKSGDPAAQLIWENMLTSLAANVVSIINIIDPEVFILGGGIVRSNETLVSELQPWINKFEWRPANHSVPIVKASLGPDAGSYGAAYSAINPSVL